MFESEKSPIGAAISGPRITGGNFMDIMLFLKYKKMFRSEKSQNESFPNFSNLRPEFCPEFCSEFSPNFSRTFCASFRGRRRLKKIHQKSPPFFNAKFPGKHEKNIHEILLESRQSNHFFTVSFFHRLHLLLFLANWGGQPLKSSLISYKHSALTNWGFYEFTFCGTDRMSFFLRGLSCRTDSARIFRFRGKKLLTEKRTE